MLPKVAKSMRLFVFPLLKLTFKGMYLPGKTWNLLTFKTVNILKVWDMQGKTKYEKGKFIAYVAQ